MGKAIVSGGKIGMKKPMKRFDLCTWEEIITACQNNSVPDTWSVGDSKSMTINKTEYTIDIIGKNHDTYATGGVAPLTFQMHDCYLDAKKMNSDNTNEGGWANCDMRNIHLPEILALMPSEVKSAIKEVNKLSSTGNLSTTINTTADKLFLLSEIEVFGVTTHSYAGEGTQYDYYKAGNSKVKSRYGSGTYWWERSPHNVYKTNFCAIDSKGVSIAVAASAGHYASFAFCF